MVVMAEDADDMMVLFLEGGRCVEERGEKEREIRVESVSRLYWIILWKDGERRNEKHL